MESRAFGRAGFSVSSVGFGAWGIGGTWWGGSPDDEAARLALRRAAELGVDFYDTALAYGDGHSESLVGRLVRETRSPALRVASKIPPKDQRWPARHDSLARDVFPADWIVSCAEKSLRNTGLERLDLIQFHVWSDSWMREDEWWRAVERLKRDGKIALWGASINDHEPDSALELVRSGRADSVQVIYNVFDQKPAERLFPLCRETKTAVIARVPFDEGSLTGTFTRDTLFPEGDFRTDYFRDRRGETASRSARLKDVASRHGLTLAQAALKFCLADPAVSTVIPGMRRPSRVEENVVAADGKPLPPALLAEFRAAAWPFWEASPRLR
jgi:aryl-alcohol dehydrogenase-like predicted oxidoreductase